MAAWQNRIIGEGEEAPDQLLANPKNARRHPQAQQQALADVLDEVGVVQRVIVNQRTGYVVDGHARIALALRQGQPTIPVLYVDLDEREEALVLATLDPISAMATTDAEKLDALLRDVHTGSAAIQTILDELATDAGLYGVGKDDGGGQPDGLWEGMPEFEQGDQTGAHKLTMHFPTMEDAAAFGWLIGQEVTKKTHFLWFPRQERLSMVDRVVTDES